MNNDNIVIGLADVSLFLANIGKKEYSKTVEEACFRLTDQNWISVDERLPEEYENVLVCAEGKVTVGQMWLFGDGSKLFTIIGVTHWMPLPKPPKDGDGE